MSISLTKHLHHAAPVVLRLGLAGVFFWFGVSQLFGQAGWIQYIPASVSSFTGLSPAALVIVNGLFETVGAVFLAYGFLTRLFGTLLGLHMILIVMVDVGWGPIGMRDIAICAAMFSVALYGRDVLSWNYRKINPGV